MLRVRFAPSPTGYLHIGGARTALFNWLYARRQSGTFVLRIEDTDTERSSWEMVAGIVDGLRWLGLDWDEGPDVGGPYAPYFQSQRVESARALAAQLVSGGRAYYCYCTAETLQQKRQAAEATAGGWVYDRTCCGLSSEEIATREAAAMPRAIRFKVPPGTTSFTDLVHGPIAFDNVHIEDFVVLRSDRQPTYHLSVVADDMDMKITHVVRGDDHISNTPKQVLLYAAFGAPQPEFAHVPLILGPDKKRLSKRHGAKGIVIAAAGAGATSGTQEEGIRYAVDKGVFVVLTTRTGSGRIASRNTASSSPRFQIQGEDLAPVKARILLMLALTKTSDGLEIQRMFTEY